MGSQGAGTSSAVAGFPALAEVVAAGSGVPKSGPTYQALVVLDEQCKEAFFAVGWQRAGELVRRAAQTCRSRWHAKGLHWQSSESLSPKGASSSKT